jgi:5-methylcytosine-specific restriction endonuclease McrA
MFNFLNKIRFATRSPKWSSIRKEHIKNNPECAACGSSKKLEVHHKIPVHIQPELELDPSNLITLCDSPCHLIFGHLFNYKSYNKTVETDCAVYLDKVKNRP